MFLDNGGIYLDLDILVLRDFSPLRLHEVSLGRETQYGLGNGIIVAQRGSPFICLWMHGYYRYRPFPWNWARYGVWVPQRLSEILPQRIHIENDHLQRPTWAEVDLFYKEKYDWSDNYSVHVWMRYLPITIPNHTSEIKRLDTTLGEIMRYIYFGNKGLR